MLHVKVALPPRKAFLRCPAIFKYSIWTCLSLSAEIWKNRLNSCLHPDNSIRNTIRHTNEKQAKNLDSWYKLTFEVVWCERDSKSLSTVVHKLPLNRCNYKAHSLRKQPKFSDATTGFPGEWRLRSKRRNAILMTRYYPDQSSGISALVSQTSFRGETCGDVTKCQLFSQAINHIDINSSSLHFSHLWLQENTFLSLLQHC